MVIIVKQHCGGTVCSLFTRSEDESQSQAHGGKHRVVANLSCSLHLRRHNFVAEFVSGTLTVCTYIPLLIVIYCK